MNVKIVSAENINTKQKKKKRKKVLRKKKSKKSNTLDSKLRKSKKPNVKELIENTSKSSKKIQNQDFDFLEKFIDKK